MNAFSLTLPACGQAFGNLLRRMIEASGRGIWNADGDMLEKLKSMYGDLDDQLEGV